MESSSIPHKQSMAWMICMPVLLILSIECVIRLYLTLLLETNFVEVFFLYDICDIRMS